MFDCTQQIVSSQTLPTLPMVLSVFDTLISSLKSLKLSLTGLDHVIAAALGKLEEYRGRALRTPAYVIAMCQLLISGFARSITDNIEVLNPSCKLIWAEKRWTVPEIISAKEMIRNEVKFINFIFSWTSKS